MLSALAHSSPASEIIPFERRVEWSANVGVRGGIPIQTNIFKYFALPANASQIQAALLACPGNEVVQLGPWTNSLQGNIDWQGVKAGVVLRGTTNTHGQPITSLAFASGFVYFRSIFDESALKRSVNLAQDGLKGQTELELAQVPAWLKAGHLYLVDQLDDPSFVTDTAGREMSGCYRMRMGCGKRGLAQLVKVIEVKGNTVRIERPLYFSWSTKFQAQLAEAGYDAASFAPRSRCGIEDLRLEQTFSNSDTHMIRMENCDSCWIRNVDSYNVAGLDHLILQFSYGCEVRDSSFRFSHLYGPGQAYGVALYDVSSACLVENNIFDHLHCAMQVNYGSSGNAFAYNCVLGGTADAREAPSIGTHGHHAFMNLFEGNYCEGKAMFDCIHGSSSHNTLFRNRILGDQPGLSWNQCAIDVDHYNRKCNAVGNVLGSKQHRVYEKKAPADHCSDGDRVIWKLGYVNAWACDSSKGFDSPEALALLRVLNYDTVTRTNNGVVKNGFELSDLPNSLLYPGKPDFFGILPWPPFDPAQPSTAWIERLPAGYRHRFGTNAPAKK